MVSSALEGKIDITVCEATLTRDTEAIGKMDPFVQLKTATQDLKTRVIDGAGKTPVWNQGGFSIDVKKSTDTLEVSVLDEDSTTNDLVGSVTIKLAEMAKQETLLDKWYVIKYKNKDAGKIRLKSTWVPKVDKKKQEAEARAAQAAKE